FRGIIRKKQSGSASHFFRKSPSNEKNLSKQQEETDGKSRTLASLPRRNNGEPKPLVCDFCKCFCGFS
ncbi:unnamed protein product, partial [Tenebrio molitor]